MRPTNLIYPTNKADRTLKNNSITSFKKVEEEKFDYYVENKSESSNSKDNYI